MADTKKVKTPKEFASSYPFYRSSFAAFVVLTWRFM
jgi:hypothetical protein